MRITRPQAATRKSGVRITRRRASTANTSQPSRSAAQSYGGIDPVTDSQLGAVGADEIADASEYVTGRPRVEPASVPQP